MKSVCLTRVSQSSPLLLQFVTIYPSLAQEDDVPILNLTNTALIGSAVLPATDTAVMIIIAG